MSEGAKGFFFFNSAHSSDSSCGRINRTTDRTVMHRFEWWHRAEIDFKRLEHRCLLYIALAYTTDKRNTSIIDCSTLSRVKSTLFGMTKPMGVSPDLDINTKYIYESLSLLGLKGYPPLLILA